MTHAGSDVPELIDRADEFDAYIVLSFVNGTLVLAVGDTIEEVSDTGFISSAPTLGVQQLGDDALLQIYSRGIRHILANRQVNEWGVENQQAIVAATSNRRQVVIALSTNEIVYFELDMDGQLNEFQERKDMGAEVVSLSIAEVPEGRQRTPYLVSQSSKLPPELPQLTGCTRRLSVAPTRPCESCRWTQSRHWRRSAFRCVCASRTRSVLILRTGPHRAAFFYRCAGDGRHQHRQVPPDALCQHWSSERRDASHGSRLAHRLAEGHTDAVCSATSLHSLF